jgi:MFS family permease
MAVEWDGTDPLLKESTDKEKRESVLKTTASYIIATEFCERLAYYGFAGNLVLFFETQLELSNVDAVNQFYIWNGFVYVTPLIGGYVADVYWTRYSTIVVFALIYLFGLLLFCVGTLPVLADQSASLLSAFVFLSIYLVALGAGGIKPNVSTLGADQFDILSYEQDARESKQFFSYFYWVINLGALLSYTLIAYCCQYGISFLGGLDWGFFIGMAITAIAMVIGIAIFLIGSDKYVINPPEGSMLAATLGIVKKAWFAPTAAAYSRAASQETEGTRSMDAGDSDQTDQTVLLSSRNGSSTQSTRTGRNPSTVEATSGVVAPWEAFPLPPSWLDRALAHGFDPCFVESVKYVWKILPFLGAMVPFWGIYGQTKTAFQLQGCQMNVDVGPVALPVSVMNIFNNISILCLVPLFQHYLYPSIERFRCPPESRDELRRHQQEGGEGEGGGGGGGGEEESAGAGRQTEPMPLKEGDWRVTMLEKIGWGFAISAVAMAVAGLIEVYRKQNVPAACAYGEAVSGGGFCQDNISPCKNVDNYDPNKYLDYLNGVPDDDGDSPKEPTNCYTIEGCAPASLSCITCDDIPQMSTISIFW